MNTIDTRPVGAARVLGLITAGLLVLTACGNSSSDESTFSVDALAQNTSDYQKKILQDGTVSAAEYEQAIMASWQCVKDTGAVADPVTPHGNRELGFGYLIEAATDEQMAQMEQAAEECHTTYASDVSAVWANQNVLSAEDRDKKRPEVVECLRSHDVEVADDATSEQLATELWRLQPDHPALICATDHADFFAIPLDGAREHSDH